MALFSSTQPSLRARILPRFPAQVLAGTGMSITKSGGTYTFATTALTVPLSQLEEIEAGTLVGRDSGSGSGAPQSLTVSGGLGTSGAGGIELTANQRVRGIPIVFNTVSAGAKQDILIPFGCTITSVTLMADVSGSVVVDIWKDTFANFPPTVADTITAAAKPTLSSAVSMQNITLTGWTTSISAGEILRFNIDSFTTITRLSVGLNVVTL